MALSWKELDKIILFQEGAFYGYSKGAITTDYCRE